MSKRKISEINIINYIKNKREINIFGNYFVNINKNICKMIIDNKEYNISEKYIVKKNNNNILKIKLKGIKKVVDVSYMFYNCSQLLSLPDISNWNTKDIISMNDLFYNCSSLKSLPDLSKWNISY